MTYMVWAKEWNTGIGVIDKQHGKIVELINELHDATSNGRTRAAVGLVLHDLIDYTVSHFSFEEELQAEAGYPYAKAHKRVHETFIKKVTDYRARFAAGEDVALEVALTLEKWLVNHIKGDDADYAPLVRARLQQEEEAPTGWLAGALNRFFKGNEA